jgi:cytochrome P450
MDRSRLPLDSTPLTPSAWFAERRAEGPACPMTYADGHEGLVVTQYETARAILADPRFSQQPQRFPMGPAAPQHATIDADAESAMDAGDLLSLDAPQHGRVRKAVLKRFSFREVPTRVEAVRALAARAMDAFLAAGSPADVSHGFAVPFATSVHALVLGIPDDRLARYRALFAGHGLGQERVDFAREMLDLARVQPAETVFSDLVRSQLTPEEQLGVSVALLSSGHDSVAYFLATGTLALLRHPDQLDALRADRTLLPGAIEEMLRYGAMFLTLFPRTATEDLEVGGVPVPAGRTVSVSPVGVNRDPSHFPDPDRFDIRRETDGHLGFGHGLHGCVGQQLARLELTEGFSLLLDLPGLRLVEADQLEPQPLAHDVATYAAGRVIVEW